MPRDIPDRWENYKPIGKRVEGTRFVAFKVPLMKDISRNVDRDIRLDDRILLKQIPNLGLIIDLTNTYRYYDPTIFGAKGVCYEKLMIPGHDTPHAEKSNKFIRIVKTFLKNNKDNDKLVGVHCTHGVNRTGYLICYYMITQMNFKPNDAMYKFSKARGHEIERKNYIESLQKLPQISANVSRTHSYETKKSFHRTIPPVDQPDYRSNNWRQTSYHKNSLDRNRTRDYGSDHTTSNAVPAKEQLRTRNSTLYVPQLRGDYYTARGRQDNTHLRRDKPKL